MNQGKQSPQPCRMAGERAAPPCGSYLLLTCIEASGVNRDGDCTWGREGFDGYVKGALPPPAQERPAAGSVNTG